MILYREVKNKAFTTWLNDRIGVRFIKRLGIVKGYYFGNREVAHEEHITYLGIVYLAEQGLHLFREVEVQEGPLASTIRDAVFAKIEEIGA